VAATVLNAALGIPLAYVPARRRFWGRGLVDLLVTLPSCSADGDGYYLIVLFDDGAARRAALRRDGMDRGVHLVRGGHRRDGDGAAAARTDRASGHRIRRS
jgi:hypothetical protein